MCTLDADADRHIIDKTNVSVERARSQGAFRSHRENGPEASLAHPLYGPLLLAQRAAVVLFDPERHTAEVEAVVALAPHHHAVLFPI